MHELTITQSILSIALEKAGTAGAARITRINLVIGELSGVVDESVQLYFDSLSRDTVAAGASLSFERVPVRLRCRDCDTVFTPANAAWACASCGGQGLEIIAGRECHIESIEVE